MSDLYLTKSRLGYITFASEISPRKIRKNINVKGFLRRGKFVRAFNRKQEVREKVVKVAVASLAVLGTALGVGVASAALTKVRYNRNLVNFGKNIAKGGIGIEGMKIPEGLKKIPRPTKITDPNKKAMTFFVGGMSKFEDAEGEKFMKLVRSAYSKQGRPIDKSNELIPLFHKYQVKRDVSLNVLGKDLSNNPVAKMGQEITDVFEKATVKGYNKDSVIMANEIYKWHILNPDKPIKIVTASAGGFQGRDIPHILEAAGVDTKKLMKVFSTASPDYGLVDEVVPTLKVMHNDDVYSKTIPGIKDGLRLPSLHRGTRFIGKGNTPEYKDMIAKKRMFDDRTQVAKENGTFVNAGRRYNLPSDSEMPLSVHFAPAYFNGETKTSKKTLEYLYNFMFKD